jgi:uncharacterized protein (TIGR02265 family)
MLATATRRFQTKIDVPLTGTHDLEALAKRTDRKDVQKGMYMMALVDQLTAAQAAAVFPRLQAPPRHGQYQQYLEYPVFDLYLWMHAVAMVKYPGLPGQEALRLLGRRFVRVFVESRVGKVTLAARTDGDTPRDALLRLPALSKITNPSLEMKVDGRGPREVHFDVKGFSGWLDSGLIGTFEEVVAIRDAVPTIDVELTGDDEAHYAVVWTAR